ncbi:YgiT-type zinc finger protein [Lentibacillus salinarum]|uniref:YgiT-type zinc finger protein n=1 Tax=Lentibacillus salinarum TaxID=446820 RepID=A0ABW3ZY54_9BACI
MFDLKAGFLGGSTAVLIRKAVEAYQPKMQKNVCCGEEMTVIHNTESFPYNYDDKECTIHVTGIPMWECKKCGEVEEDVSLMAAVEKSADQAFEALLKSGDQIPDEMSINFNDMLEVKEPEQVASG